METTLWTMEKKAKIPRKEPKVAQPLARSIEPLKTNADGHRRWRADLSRSRRSFSESQSDPGRVSIRILTVEGLSPQKFRMPWRRPPPIIIIIIIIKNNNNNEKHV